MPLLLVAFRWSRHRHLICLWKLFIWSQSKSCYLRKVAHSLTTESCSFCVHLDNRYAGDRQERGSCAAGAQRICHRSLIANLEGHRRCALTPQTVVWFFLFSSMFTNFFSKLPAIDVQLGRAAVKAIGRCAIKVQPCFSGTIFLWMMNWAYNPALEQAPFNAAFSNLFF